MSSVQTSTTSGPKGPSDRRPLASRNSRVMKALAAWLAGRRCSPNLISLAGMFAGIIAGGLLAWTGHGAEGWVARGCYLGAAACVQFRLLCNLIDGMVAVEGGMKSVVGDLYNDVPDRVSDVGTLVGAGYAAASCPELGYLAAIVAVMTAYIRAVGKALTGVADYRGPMAKQQRMAAITVVCVYLGAAPEAWRPVLEPVVQSAATGDIRWRGAFGLMALALAIIALGGVATCWRRLSAIARALRSRAA
ncbi:MAG: CDP-alcohol phosphatidyltransferase family protein [Phycisphaerales bacterium]